MVPHVPNPAAGSPTHRASVIGTKSKQSLLGRSASPASARKSPAGGAHDGRVVTGTNPMLELEEDPAPRETEVEKDAATRFGGRSAGALSEVMRHMRQSYEKGHVKKPEKVGPLPKGYHYEGLAYREGFLDEAEAVIVISADSGADPSRLRVAHG